MKRIKVEEFAECASADEVEARIRELQAALATVQRELAKHLSAENENARRGDLVACIRDLAQIKVTALDNEREALQQLATVQRERVAELSRISQKLEAGTLHVVYCNGNHDERVGKAGMVCNCTLGQEIHQLRHAKDAAEARCAALAHERATFVARCREIRNGSPNAFYALVDAFCNQEPQP